MHTKRPGLSNSADSLFSSCQKAPVIWKSLPWWPITSRKALSRPNSKYSRAVLVPSVSLDWPCVSPQKCTSGVSLGTTRSGFERHSSLPSSSTRTMQSPGASRRRPSTVAAKLPGSKRSVGGSPAIARSLTSRSVRSLRLEGLPHLSSALMESRNCSPARTRVGRTARQRTPGPGTMAILGLSGSAT